MSSYNPLENTEVYICGKIQMVFNPETSEIEYKRIAWYDSLMFLSSKEIDKGSYPKVISVTINLNEKDDETFLNTFYSVKAFLDKFGVKLNSKPELKRTSSFKLDNAGERIISNEKRQEYDELMTKHVKMMIKYQDRLKKLRKVSTTVVSTPLNFEVPDEFYEREEHYEPVNFEFYTNCSLPIYDALYDIGIFEKNFSQQKYFIENFITHLVIKR